MSDEEKINAIYGALVGNGKLGHVGLVDRIAAIEKRQQEAHQKTHEKMECIERKMFKEKWLNRAVVFGFGTGGGAFGTWLKSLGGGGH